VSADGCGWRIGYLASWASSSYSCGKGNLRLRVTSREERIDKSEGVLAEFI